MVALALVVSVPEVEGARVPTAIKNANEILLFVQKTMREIRWVTIRARSRSI